MHAQSFEIHGVRRLVISEDEDEVIRQLCFFHKALAGHYAVQGGIEPKGPVVDGAETAYKPSQRPGRIDQIGTQTESAFLVADTNDTIATTAADGERIQAAVTDRRWCVLANEVPLELVIRISQKPTAWQQKQRQRHKQHKYPFHDISIPHFLPPLVRISSLSADVHVKAHLTGHTKHFPAAQNTPQH